MMKTARLSIPALLLALVAGASFAWTPAPVLAQQDGVDLERAEALEARAEAMSLEEGRYARAAGLFRRAASFRDDADPQKVENLMNAARFSHYAGRNARALEDAQQAARLAQRQGDVVRAGHAYLDAAWLAAKSGERERMQDFVQEALLLAQSPLLAQSDRSAILRRVGEAAS